MLPLLAVSYPLGSASATSQLTEDGSIKVTGAEHATHAVDASMSMSALPAAHGLHTVAPDAAYVPLPHATHAVVASESVSALPAMHCTHAVAPTALGRSVAEPASHLVHATVDALLHCPAAQAVHDDAPAARPEFVTEPARHSVHATVDARLY